MQRPSITHRQSVAVTSDFSNKVPSPKNFFKRSITVDLNIKPKQIGFTTSGTMKRKKSSKEISVISEDSIRVEEQDNSSLVNLVNDRNNDDDSSSIVLISEKESFSENSHIRTHDHANSEMMSQYEPKIENLLKENFDDQAEKMIYFTMHKKVFISETLPEALCSVKVYDAKDLFQYKGDDLQSSSFMVQGAGPGATQINTFLCETYNKIVTDRKCHEKKDIFTDLHIKLPTNLASSLMSQNFDSLYSGSQCTYFYIMNNILHFGNLGDIKLIILYQNNYEEWKYKVLSKVHSINSDPKELKRLKGNGVKFDNGSFYPSFLKEEDFTLQNKLVSTRYIGMFGAMSDGVNYESYTGKYQITEKDKIL